MLSLRLSLAPNNGGSSGEDGSNNSGSSSSVDDGNGSNSSKDHSSGDKHPKDRSGQGGKGGSGGGAGQRWCSLHNSTSHNDANCYKQGSIRLPKVPFTPQMYSVPTALM